MLTIIGVLIVFVKSLVDVAPDVRRRVGCFLVLVDSSGMLPLHKFLQFMELCNTSWTVKIIP